MNSYAENADKFNCEQCDVKCCKQSDWDRHVLTRKHQNRTTTNQNYADKLFVCKKCDKTYKARNSLWYHENKCSVKPTSVEKINEGLLNLICEQTKAMEKITNHNTELQKQSFELQKQNTELVSKTLELCKPVNNNNTTINQTNNNQKFNINLFLNETCKDAINFSDFVKNIQISYEDLENNAQLGFVNGISKIFLDNLKQLDVNERPIHCTDVKRETMYIKDENTWTKQPDDEKLQKAIQTVSYRSMGKLAEWKQENPDYKDCNSDFSQKCLDIQRQTLAGSERGVYYPKVIHALARETIIEK
jgi:hypothetical protein